jgi:NAD(P)-dependent dehydrogenase (short-subunit alcohol dehydrogenase family)
MEVRMKKRRVLITGGTKGLGFAIAKRAVSEGSSVFIVGRDERRLAWSLEALNQGPKHAPLAFGASFDIGDKHAIHPLVALAQEALGDIDMVIHNASTLGPLPMPLLSDLACEAFEAVLAVNLLGPFRLTKAVATSMALRGSGDVLFVSSDAAVSHYTNWGAYGVSKAAQDKLMGSFSAEFPEMHEAALPGADPQTLASPDAVAAWVWNELLEAASSGVRYTAPSMTHAQAQAPHVQTHAQTGAS